MTMLLNETRLAEALRRSGCDALVATTAQNVEYASGYHSERMHNFVGLQTYAVVPADASRICLILPSTEMVHLGSKRTSASRLKRYGRFFVMAEPGASFTAEESRLQELLASVPVHDTPVEALAAALEEAGLASARIGLDEHDIAWPVLEQLKARLPRAAFEPASHWFRFMRMVKTDPEVALIREVCDINERAMAAAVAEIRTGVPEDLPYRTFREAVARAGAVPRLWGTSSGANSSCFFWPGQRVLERGDLVRIDCGCTWQGYWADTGITVVCGEPRQDHRRVYDILKLAIEAGVEAARPGTPVTAVAERVMQVAKGEGLADLERHHCGHGIGRELYEPPMLVREGAASDIFAGGAADTLLEPNMVINVEAPYYRLGFGGLHLEHTVLVTPDGPELLTGARDLVVNG